MSAKRKPPFKTAFPEAARFEGRKIAAEMVSALDKGNETYIRAIDKDGQLIGYLRDFTGPVTPHEDCPCSPLMLPSLSQLSLS